MSVIVPTFNSSQYVEKTISSVCEQSYQNWELILVDDCSTDDTVSIARSLALVDPRIQVYEMEINSGAGPARNYAIQRSRGKYIAFLDSDDWWEPEKLYAQIAHMEAFSLEICYTSYRIVNSGGNNTGKIYRAKKILNQSDYMKDTIIGFSTAVINRDLVEGELKMPPLRTRQDTSFWISLLGTGLKAFPLDLVLTNYRVHSDSLSSNKFKAAKTVWWLYRKYHKFTWRGSIYYFAHYVFNTLKKRLF